MAQPTAVDIGLIRISGSLDLADSRVDYVIDGTGKDYRSGYQGLDWIPAVPEEDKVVFINATDNLGRGPAGAPLFWRSATKSSADILTIANGLPGSPRNFTDTGSAYDWALASQYFIKDKPFGGFYVNNLKTYLDPGLIGSYPTTLAKIYDLSGNAYGGTLNNSPAYNPLGWLDFDGTNDYIAVNPDSFRSTSTPGTIEAVFNIKDYSNAQLVVGTTENRDRAISIVDAGHIRGNQYNGTIGLFCGGQWRPPVQDKFHHVAFAYTVNNGAGTSQYALWVDGEKRAEQFPATATDVGADTSVNNWGGTSANNISDGGPSRSNFGGVDNSTPGFFSGSIERFLTHNSFLTDDQILQNYYQAPIVTDGLQFAVDPFNICSYPRYGTTTFSLSGSQNGSLVAGTGWLTDNGGVWDFDGTDDRIQFSNSFPEVYELFTEPAKPYSVCTWAYCTATGDRTIIAKSGGWGGSATFALGYLSGPGITTVIRGTRTNAFPAGFSYNKWYNISLTWDGTTLKLYVDGIFIQNMNVGTVSNQNYNMHIGGADPSGTTNPFLGNIGPILLYNKALSISELSQNCSAMSSRFNA